MKVKRLMQPFKNILYVAEATDAQGAALARAVSLSENNQADLTVLGVVPEFAAYFGIANGPTSEELQTHMVAQRREQLQTLIAPYRERLEIKLEVRVGKTFLEAIRMVMRGQHDLLMKQTEEPGFIERMFGSDDMHLLRKCPCPVWLMQPHEKANYACIVAAVDFDFDLPGVVDNRDASLNQTIVDLSGALALSDFAALNFVHVWDAPGEMTVRSWASKPDEAADSYVDGLRSHHENALNHLRGQVKDRLGEVAFNHLSPRFHLLRGAAAKVIPDTARRLQADLVVMGTVARSGIAGLVIGNTAESILSQLHCSVLAVKPDGFVSPVKTSV